MNPLLLSGWGIKVKTGSLKSRSELELWNGHEYTRLPTRMCFRPRRFEGYDSVVICGYSGYMSLRAVHWLSRNGIPVYVLDVDGSLLSTILPAMPVKADLRIAQIDASRDPEKKFMIAKSLVEVKIARSLQVLSWLSDRYDIARDVHVTRLEASKLKRTRTVAELRIVEGRVAQRYWEAYGKVLPSHLEFRGRAGKHNMNASDVTNASLNFGYGLLQAQCTRAVNAVGLESAVGFLHEFSDYQTKQSLVYDLEEPFRWLIDLTVIQAFESRVLDLDTFHFKLDDYRFRFNPEARERFVELLKERFNQRAEYRGQRLRWDTVIQEKTSELARYLAGKASTVDFTEPSPNLERVDSWELRERIKSLTSHEAKRMGVGKSTLHYLRRNARCERPFRVYGKVGKKLNASVLVARSV